MCVLHERYGDGYVYVLVSRLFEGCGKVEPSTLCFTHTQTRTHTFFSVCPFSYSLISRKNSNIIHLSLARIHKIQNHTFPFSLLRCDEDRMRFVWKYKNATDWNVEKKSRKKAQSAKEEKKRFFFKKAHMY